MDDRNSDSLIDLGVAAALSDRYAADQHDFAIYLADLLDSVLPAETRVQRRGGLFTPKEVTSVSVHLDDYLYTLHVPARGPLTPARTKVVRGIKLKTEPMPMEEWVAALGTHLAELARRNQQTSCALQRLLDDGP